MSTETKHIRSGPLKVTVQREGEEGVYWWFLISVEGNEEAPDTNTLSDVDWFTEEASNSGLEDLLWPDEAIPDTSQPITIEGYLWAEHRHTPVGDYDVNCGFETTGVSTLSR